MAMNSEQLRSFLKELERRVPPASSGLHHSIHFARYGSDDETGWEDRLCVAFSGVRRADPPPLIVFLDDGDLDKPVEQLVDEVVAIAKRIVPSTAAVAA